MFKKNHYGKFLKKEIDPDLCSIKDYQDLLLFHFTRDHLPHNPKILEVGPATGTFRIFSYFSKASEYWFLDHCNWIDNAPNFKKRTDCTIISCRPGTFHPGIPNGYFDLVFSNSSALNPSDPDKISPDDVFADINRMVKPGKYSFHFFDIILKSYYVWTPAVLTVFFQEINPLAPIIPFVDIAGDTDLWTIPAHIYREVWQPRTKMSLEEFGKPFSYNLFWEKGLKS